MRRLSKKGDEKYYIIISLILGILVLSISIYFIYKEYFDANMTSYETCRQSVMLRTMKISEDGAYGKIVNKALDASFPFECKTEVVNINYKDTDKALKEISDDIASCFYLYGEGKKPLYASNWITPQYRYCFVCYRVHFSDDVKDYYKSLNVGEYLTKAKMKDGKTYFDYIYMSIPKEIVFDSKELSDYEQNTKNAMLSVSNFDASNGDILIMNNFVSSASNKIPLLSWILKIFGARGWSSGVSFFQPNVKPGYLNDCAKIETIPA